jgi:hypothetical protein
MYQPSGSSNQSPCLIFPSRRRCARCWESQLRGLWSQPLVRRELDRICRSIAKAGFWREGWLGVCQTLKHDSKGIEDEARAKLIRLEKTLRPKDLVQKVRGVVLATNSHGLDFDDLDYDDDDGANSFDR